MHACDLWTLTFFKNYLFLKLFLPMCVCFVCLARALTGRIIVVVVVQ